MKISRFICALLLMLLLFPASGLAVGPFGGSVFDWHAGKVYESPGLCGTERGIYRFDGDEWKRLAGLSGENVVSIAVSGDVFLAVAKGKGVFSSVDGGTTWKKLANGLKNRYGHRVDDINEVVADYSDPGRFYLGSAGKGFFETRDGGESWSLVNEGLENRPNPSQYVSEILPPRKGRPLLMGTEGDGLFIRENGKWKAVGEGALPKALKVTSLAEDPENSDHLAMGTGSDGVFESFDGGRSWKPRFKGSYGVVNAVSVGKEGVVAAFLGQDGLCILRPDRKDIIKPMGYKVVRGILPDSKGGFYLSLLDDGILKVDAGGEITGDLNNGLAATTIYSFADDPGGKGIWAGDGNGAFFSADGGKTWESRDKGLIVGNVSGLVRIGNDLFAGTGGQGVFLWSRESGEWLFRGKELGTSNTIFSMDKTVDGRVFVGTEAGVLWSGNMGVNWARSQGPFASFPRTSIAAHPSDKDVMLAAFSKGLFKTADSGQTWTELKKGDFSLASFGRDEGFAASRETLFKVAGKAVTEVFSEPGGEVTAILPTPKGLYVGTGSGLYFVSGGKNEKIYRETAVTALYLDREGRVWVGTAGRGAFPIAGK